MVYCTYTKCCIVYYNSLGYKPPVQKLLLDEENIIITRQAIARFLKVYRQNGRINQWQGFGRKPKTSEKVKRNVEGQMQRDDEQHLYSYPDCYLLKAMSSFSVLFFAAESHFVGHTVGVHIANLFGRKTRQSRQLEQVCTSRIHSTQQYGQMR